MANNCITMYRFFGDNAKKLFDDLSKVQDNHKGTHSTWCKHIATDLLDYTEEDIDKGKIYVRGQFFVENYDDNELMVDTDTAWHPCQELFDELADKYELSIYWMADERGCCGVWSNDTEHSVWDWEYIAYDGESGEEEWFNSEADAVEWINERIDKPIKELSELDNDNISVTEVEYYD